MDMMIDTLIKEEWKPVWTETELVQLINSQLYYFVLPVAPQYILHMHTP